MFIFLFFELYLCIYIHIIYTLVNSLAGVCLHGSRGDEGVRCRCRVERIVTSWNIQRRRYNTIVYYRKYGIRLSKRKEEFEELFGGNCRYIHQIDFRFATHSNSHWFLSNAA